MSDKDKHAEASSKGGKKSGILKGFAWLKENDPKRLKKIIKERELKRNAKEL